MGKFNIQRARGTLPGRATQVRADLDVRTGGQQMAQAVTGLGSAIANLGDKYYRTQAVTQLSRAERIAVEEMNRLSLSFEGNLDPETYLKDYEKSLETIRKSTSKILTNKMAAADFGLFLNDREPQWENSVKKAQKSRIVGNYLDELFEEQAEKEQSGIYGDFSDYVAKGVAEGWISKREGLRFIVQTKKLIKEKQEELLLAKYQSQMLQLAVGAGYDVALAQADSPEFRKELVDSGLPIEKHQSLINALKASIVIQRTKEAENLEINRESNRKEFYAMLEAKNYDGIYEFLSGTVLDEDEKDKLNQRANQEAERIARGEHIITDQGTKHQLLDDASAINWPERGITAQEVREKARLARYGAEPKIDDVAYDEVRDAIRKAEEDKIPFTQKNIENIIGELITGAPSSILGLPLPTLRTREDAIKHATNAFGRFVNRIPGVMDTINAKYPPEKNKSTPTEPKDNPAYDFDGELIGSKNSDGTITLNWEGTRRLWELSGRDAKKAREMAVQNRYVIPLLKE